MLALKSVRILSATAIVPAALSVVALLDSNMTTRSGSGSVRLIGLALKEFSHTKLRPRLMLPSPDVPVPIRLLTACK